MRVFLLLLISLLTAENIPAQSDQAAIKILDGFSAASLGAPSISMKFTMDTADQVEGTNTSTSGLIIISRDRYRLETPDNLMWYNGKTMWSLLPEEKEVTITEPEKSDNSFLSNPSAVFTLYKKGYKVRLLEESSDSYLIDLYPEAMDADHIRIRLNILKPSLDLKSLEYKYKNGITVFLSVKEYDLKKQPAGDEFTFPAARYKGVEVIDMR